MTVDLHSLVDHTRQQPLDGGPHKGLVGEPLGREVTDRFEHHEGLLDDAELFADDVTIG